MTRSNVSSPGRTRSGASSVRVSNVSVTPYVEGSGREEIREAIGVDLPGPRGAQHQRNHDSRGAVCHTDLHRDFIPTAIPGKLPPGKGRNAPPSGAPPP